MTPKKTYLNSLTTTPTPKKQYATPALTAVSGTTQGPKAPAPGNTAYNAYKNNLASPTPNVSDSWKKFGATQTTTGAPTQKTGAAPGVNTGITASNPSSTSPSGTTLNAAGQQYASQLQGIKDKALEVQQQFQSQGTAATPEKKSESEYLKYLRSMFNPEEAKMAQANITALNQQTADEIARNRKNMEGINKNEVGMLEKGQDYLATNEGRDSAKALADLAISKGYSTDILNQFTSAGKSLYEAEEAMRKEADSPLSLAEATALQVPFGTTMAEARLKGVVPGGSTSTYTPGANPVVDSWVTFVNGGGDMSKVPDEYKNQVVQGVTPSGPGNISPYQQERMTRNISSVDDLMTRVTPWTSGYGSLLSVLPTSDARDFQADLNTLKANIAFGELTAMREASKTGGALGAVSEKELMLLESALGALDTGQSGANLTKNLQQIKDSIQRWQTAQGQYGGASGGTGFAETW